MRTLDGNFNHEIISVNLQFCAFFLAQLMSFADIIVYYTIKDITSPNFLIVIQILNTIMTEILPSLTILFLHHKALKNRLKDKSSQINETNINLVTTNEFDFLSNSNAEEQSEKLISQPQSPESANQVENNRLRVSKSMDLSQFLL